MTAANARFRTSVTANCKVNPTAAIASTADVMSPKTTEATNMLMVRSPPTGRAESPRGRPEAQRSTSPRDRAQLGRCDVPRHLHRARRGIGVNLENARRVVEGVEARRSAWTYIADGLARLELPYALGEGVHGDRAGNAIAYLCDPRLPLGSLSTSRSDHRERGQIHAVIQVHGAWGSEVGVEVAGLGPMDLALDSKQRLSEGLVGRPACRRDEVVGVEVGREGGSTHRVCSRLIESRRDRGGRADYRDHFAVVELLDLVEQGRISRSERLGHDCIRVRLHDLLRLGAERRRVEIQRLVRDYSHAVLCDRLLGRLHEGLRSDVVAEG